MAWFILIISCGLIALQIWQDVRTFPKFEAMSDSTDRRKVLRYWTVDSFIRYGVLGTVALFIVGAPEALWTLPSDVGAGINEFTASINLSPGRAAIGGYGLAGVLALGLLAGAVAGFYIKSDAVPKDGVGALLARNWKEARWTGAISINAGVVEEIFFRALLFIVLFQVSESILLAMIGSTVLFAVAHAYQGIGGVLTSGLLGAMFMVIYAATGALWLVILLHALIDLRGLVLLPWSLGWLSHDGAGSRA